MLDFSKYLLHTSPHLTNQMLTAGNQHTLFHSTTLLFNEANMATSYYTCSSANLSSQPAAFDVSQKCDSAEPILSQCAFSA